jgi:hypothetical protein
MRENPALISPRVLKKALATNKIAIKHFQMRNLG